MGKRDFPLKIVKNEGVKYTDALTYWNHWEKWLSPYGFWGFAGDGRIDLLWL